MTDQNARDLARTIADRLEDIILDQSVGYNRSRIVSAVQGVLLDNVFGREPDQRAALETARREGMEEAVKHIIIERYGNPHHFARVALSRMIGIIRALAAKGGDACPYPTTEAKTVEECIAKDFCCCEKAGTVKEDEEIKNLIGELRQSIPSSSFRRMCAQEHTPEYRTITLLLSLIQDTSKEDGR